MIMTSAQILSDIRQNGIELKVEDAKLLFRSARSVSPDLRAAIRTHKTEIMELLQKPTSPVDLEKLEELEKGFTCLDEAPLSAILCVVHPEQPEWWVAFRRTRREQQGLGSSQSAAVLNLAQTEGDVDGDRVTE